MDQKNDFMRYTSAFISTHLQVQNLSNSLKKAKEQRKKLEVVLLRILEHKNQSTIDTSCGYRIYRYTSPSPRLMIYYTSKKK
jgi:hypothetical protein